MAKGFVFSVDALLAVVVLAAMAMAIAFLLSAPASSPYEGAILERQANDMLIALDKANLLGSQNATYVSSVLNQTLPASLSARLEIRYYNYSGGFLLEGNRTLGGEYPGTADISVAQREFLVFANSSIRYYGIARLALWAQ